MVKVHCDEGVAIRIGPEPCAVPREGIGEASVGVRAGQPLSRVSRKIPSADTVDNVEGDVAGCYSASIRLARRGRRTWHIWKISAREPGDLRPDHPLIGVVRIGKARSRSDHERAGEVRPLYSSEEAGEQPRTIGCGVGGAKGGGQGELGSASHIPTPSRGSVSSGPETFNFLGLAHVCGRSHAGKFHRCRDGGSTKWFAATLRITRYPLIRGALMRFVTTSYAFGIIRFGVAAKRIFTSWERISRLALDYPPIPRILHPWTSTCFDVNHPRWKPNA